MTEVTSQDARTGALAATVSPPTTAAEVAAGCEAAAAAAPALDRAGRGFRAGLLRTLAGALEADRDRIVPLADRETALGTGRLNGELTRTCYQLRFFAAVLDEGSYLEAAIDHPGETPMGQRPDLRRMLVPIGPVAVFGAANFPLAFSVPGGDTASALAAGCPVVAKAHPSHPATSRRCFEVMRAAAARFGAAAGTLEIVYGQDAGVALVTDPRIRAVGFTGSLRGGSELAGLAAARPEPIPFYGELSSTNPVVITPAAASERAGDIASGLVASVTLGGGQFCTKPGLIFLPADEAGSRVRAAMATLIGGMEPHPALNAGIHRAYQAGMGQLAGTSAADRLAEGHPGPDGAHVLRPALFSAAAGQFGPGLLPECFGPAAVLVSYQDTDELAAALRQLPGSLAAAVHLGAAEDPPAEIIGVLRDRTGRLLFNGYPTGVMVSWAQHHGGPWPATDSLHSSVGATAIRRFLRPVAWQDAPAGVLPPELRDGPATIPRRVDGMLVLPADRPPR